MSLSDSFIEYVKTVRRYSPRTVQLYSDALAEFLAFALEGGEAGDSAVLSSLTPQVIRSYEVHLLDKRGLNARTVGLHLSVLSSFCRHLIHQGKLASNPVRLVSRPKTARRLPVFYKASDMTDLLETTSHDASEDSLELLEALPAGDSTRKSLYEARLRRAIVQTLYSTGMRRSELISLTGKSFDFSRSEVKVLGKGNKPREIPLTAELSAELGRYVEARDAVLGAGNPESPFFLTFTGRALYPVYVDRAVKAELALEPGVTARRSPHVLRHTLATELLDNGADLNSIKELLGHASLAATQVYTHNTVERLRKVYAQAHPRAKKKQ